MLRIALYYVKQTVVRKHVIKLMVTMPPIVLVRLIIMIVSSINNHSNSSGSNSRAFPKYICVHTQNIKFNLHSVFIHLLLIILTKLP